MISVVLLGSVSEQFLVEVPARFAQSVFVSATAFENPCRSGVVSAMRGSVSPHYIDEGNVLMRLSRSQVMWPDWEECALENFVLVLILVI